MATLPTDRSTSSTAAQHLDDHDALHAKFNTDVIWLAAERFQLVTGAPTLAQQNSIISGWLLDSAAAEAVSTSIVFPSDWTTYDVTVFWATDATPAGATNEVVFEFFIASFDEGEQLAGYAEVAQATCAVTNVGIGNLLFEDLVVDNAAVPAGAIHAIKIARNPVDAADDYADDVALIGVKITKAS